MSALCERASGGGCCWPPSPDAKNVNQQYDIYRMSKTETHETPRCAGARGDILSMETELSR